MPAVSTQPGAEGRTLARCIVAVVEHTEPRGGTSTPRRGRPTGDHAERRAELIRAATSIIAREGYGACSLRNVASAAGYTTGAVTYYFRNKSELITALATHRFDTYETLLEPLSERSSVRAMLTRWMDITVADREQSPVMSQLVMFARQDSALAEILQDRYGRFRAHLATMISVEQRLGTIRSDIPAAVLAENVTAMGDGWAMLAPIEPDRFTPDKVMGLLDAVDTLLRPLS
ncbi:TetR/AcrR family transcriptional regulator [Rhodococcus erythropolis]|nr:TetR/AcrR family transcriptional regulator [Rhodococcus erythropolis]